MTDPRVQQLLEQAVGETYADWARRRPSLASVIDRMSVLDRAAESVRATPAFAEAVAQYHRAGEQGLLLERLAGLAETVLTTILR